MRKPSAGAVLMVTLLALSLSTLVDLPEEASAYTPRPPILIVGNWGFVPVNGVTEGNGTSSNPFVIEGWEINASSTDGIRIMNTTSHFIIRNVYVHSGVMDPFDFHRGIALYNASNARLENVIATNNDDGIRLYRSRNVSVENCEILSNGAGITVWFSEDANITIAHNNVSRNGRGIYTFAIGNVTISQNNLTENREAARIYSSSNTTVMDNRVFSNANYGIAVDKASNIVVVNNTISKSGAAGLYLSSATRVSVASNTFTSDGILMFGDRVSHFNSHTIESDNTVNGKQIEYYKNCSSLEFDDFQGGQLLVANCTSVRVTNSTIQNTAAAIGLAFIGDATVSNNSISDNYFGIYLSRFDNASIIGNTLDNNTGSGIGLAWGYEGYVSGNQIQSSRGITLSLSSNVTVTENSISMSSFKGIYLYGTRYSTIARNEVTGTQEGIRLWLSENNTVDDNRLLSNEESGIHVRTSANNTILRNNISSSESGVLVVWSTSTRLQGNVISSNQQGFRVSHSEGMIADHNDFINNTIQAIDDNGDENSWDNGYPEGGNHWSDYVGTDDFSGPNQDVLGPDGIGDDPYVIDADSWDRYPLMRPSGVPRPWSPMGLQASLSGKDMENVTLNWFLSPNDGIGQESVVGYEVFRNSTYHPTGLAYGLIATVPNGTSTFVDSLAGEGDPSNYFYRVCAVDSNGTSTCILHQAAKFTRPLTPGPNLVSVPLIQSNESIEHVLQTVEYDKAWFYDSLDQEWKSYVKFKSYRTLNHIDHIMGIWIDVTEESNLTIAGIVPAQTTIHLHKGWNLVGFPSLKTSYTVSDLNVEVGSTRVEGYDSLPPCYLRVLGDVEVLQAGYGYWVKVETDMTWTVEVA
ncbi:MAG: hypothetical protein E3J35_08450 [Methanomassiliicoccales archaeon]|nr:MAG: hypothetical protein E3J35_08450 [Methanomassiliicoccales archaeon]